MSEIAPEQPKSNIKERILSNIHTLRDEAFVDFGIQMTGYAIEQTRKLIAIKVIVSEALKSQVATDFVSRQQNWEGLLFGLSLAGIVGIGGKAISEVGKHSLESATQTANHLEAQLILDALKEKKK